MKTDRFETAVRPDARTIRPRAAASRAAAWLVALAACVAVQTAAIGCELAFRSHVPQGLAPDAPLVVALHGCAQDAAEYERDSGWTQLADRHGFIVLYVEQPRCNNPAGCFNWFEPADIQRGSGEVGEIHDAVQALRARSSIDPDRIFVSGFSAGAAMGVVLLAAYPEEFAAGAVVAALPYRIASGSVDAWPSMLVGKDRTPQAWGDLVRETHPGYDAAYPRLAIFHGTSDRTVNPVNMRELSEQWTNLHATDTTPDATDEIGAHRRQEYRDSQGRPVVVTYTLAGMGHALPVDPGSGPGQGGSTGQWAKDVDLYYSYRALQFWGLVP